VGRQEKVECTCSVDKMRENRRGWFGGVMMRREDSTDAIRSMETSVDGKKRKTEEEALERYRCVCVCINDVGDRV